MLPTFTDLSLSQKHELSDSSSDFSLDSVFALPEQTSKNPLANILENSLEEIPSPSFSSTEKKEPIFPPPPLEKFPDESTATHQELPYPQQNTTLSSLIVPEGEVLPEIDSFSNWGTVSPLPDDKENSSAPLFHDWDEEKQNKRYDSLSADAQRFSRWQPWLQGSIAALPTPLKQPLILPDVPAENQEEHIASDILQAWAWENHPELAPSPQDLREFWEDSRQDLAQYYQTENNNTALLQQISSTAQEHAHNKQQLESLIQETSQQNFRAALRGHILNPPAAQEFLDPTETSSTPALEAALLLSQKTAQQKGEEFAPLYQEMRTATKLMAAMEEVSPPNVSTTSLAGSPGELQLPLPFNFSSVIEGIPKLIEVGTRLSVLPATDRNTLFHQLEEDIIAERERKRPKTPSFQTASGQAISRSHLKTAYGTVNFLTALNSSIQESLAEKAIQLGFFSDFFEQRRNAAQLNRDIISNIQRLRTIMETRESPLYAQKDGRGAPPERHWIGEIGLSFAEESVPLALSIGFRPALLGYAPTVIGNHYAINEANAQAQRDTNASAPQLPHSQSTPLANRNRLLGATASGILQTLIEGGLPLHKLTPLWKTFPKMSTAANIATRPYLEQKGYAMSQPLGEVLGQYATDLIQEPETAALNTQKLGEAWGDLGENFAQYLATLPFVMLAAGKISLNQIKSKNAILNDPALKHYYKIPENILEEIRNETRYKFQSKLFHEAIKNSPVWKNPQVLQESAELFNALEIPRSNSTHNAAPLFTEYTAADIARLIDPHTIVGKTISPPTHKTNISPLKNISPSETFSSNLNHPALGSLSLLENNQFRWHNEAGLPRLKITLEDNSIAWKMKIPTQFGYTEKSFSSPAQAFLLWRASLDIKTDSHRVGALYPEKFFDLNVNRTPLQDLNRIHDIIRKTTNSLQTLPAQYLLFKTNINPPKNITEIGIKRLENKTKNRLFAYTIEDCYQYMYGNNPQAIMSHRLTQTWLDEFSIGNVTPSQAKKWISLWEQRNKKPLTGAMHSKHPLNTPHLEEAKLLANIGLNSGAEKITNILPPRFAIPNRLAIQELFSAGTLSTFIAKTPYYKQELWKKQPYNDAIWQSIAHFTEFNLENLRPHFSLLPQKDLISAAHISTVEIHPKTQESFLWLSEHGLSPLISITDPQTKKQGWMARYPSGELSRPHNSPREALYDWEVFGMQITPQNMADLGLNANIELADFFYAPHSGNKFSSTELDFIIDKTAPEHLIPQEILNARKDIFHKQNGPIEGLLDTEGLNVEFITPEGHLVNNISIFNTNDAFPLIEENAETIWRSHLRLGDFSLKDAEKFLRKLETSTHNRYLQENTEHKSPDMRYLDILEGLSQVSTEFMLLQNNNSKIPQAARQWMNFIISNPEKKPDAIPLLASSSALKSAWKNNNIPTQFLSLLEDSVGINTPMKELRLTMQENLPQQERLLPLISQPKRLAEFLSPAEQKSLIKELLSLKNINPDSTLTAKEKYLSTLHILRQAQKQWKETPELLRWDFDPKTQSYRYLQYDDTHAALIEKTLPEKLNTPENTQAIHVLSSLKRSRNNALFTAEDGIHHADKIYSLKSPDRPQNIPQTWHAQKMPYHMGIIYKENKSPSKKHLVTLLYGNDFDIHKSTQKPYIRHYYQGHYLNAKGEITTSRAPDSYINIDDFDIKKIPTTITPKDKNETINELLETLSSPEKIQSLLRHNSHKNFTTKRDLILELYNAMPSPYFSKPIISSIKKLMDEINKSLTHFNDRYITKKSLAPITEQATLTAQQILKEKQSNFSPSSPKNTK